MSDRSRLRLVVLRVIVVSILLTLLGRVWQLQVPEGAAYQQAASANRVRLVATPAGRGLVLDDRGVPLVGNRTALVVSVNRSLLRTAAHHGRDVLARLSAVVRTPVAELTAAITPCGEALAGGAVAKSPDCWNGSPYQPVPVAQYATDKPGEVARVLQVEEHAEDFTGVTTDYEAVREYPHGTLAAHTLGYLGPLQKQDLAAKKYAGLPSGTLVGRVGVEASYDDALRGRAGVQRLVVDKDGNVTGSTGAVPPTAGQDLVLSLDAGVQKVAEDALARGIARARTQYDKQAGRNYAAPSGAVVVMEAATGRVVALASNPTYDPTSFVGGISRRALKGLAEDPGHPLVSNATQGLFAPGSTFKIVSTAAAVAAGNDLYGAYPCPPQLKVGTSVFHNFEGETYGDIDLHTTLVKSCDTVYYKLAFDEWLRDGGAATTGRPREVFPKMARSFGLGNRTGIDLPPGEESRGTITDRGYKQRDWEQRKPYFCAGAKNPGYSAYVRAIQQENCTDGYRYNAGDLVNFAIGQGDVLVTPLQMATAYAALANGGTLYAPRVAKGLLAADGRTVTPIPPVKKGTLPVSAEVLSYIRSALAGVPQQGGTAQGAFKGFPFGQLAVAGKTGTADVNGKSPTSWFCSFAPAAAPKYVVIAMVPEGGTGGTTAAPIVRAVYDGMYGLEGRKAVLTHGSLPGPLPVVLPDGRTAAPGTAVPRTPAVEPLTRAPQSPVRTAPGPARHRTALGRPSAPASALAHLSFAPPSDLPSRHRSGRRGDA